MRNVLRIWSRSQKSAEQDKKDTMQCQMKRHRDAPSFRKPPLLLGGDQKGTGQQGDKSPAVPFLQKRRTNHG
ncbi:hypothetical protein NCU11290 [Neurospora crassa OR74A]|uniref:Uncharacterized protein n=1 Tax=Neurospora crassa (strain ATCC 24698 / 74-OR23-1A / CBS 708.71 / DSM 1257 / FGSC 987) TaxID=367110 RepID=A7UWH9_NEUCR|nr:hypothetical protein NCU11290 [Neurospora crassa OR74A]EDO65190.2 hypothetical protein NCU11290 [Neurospora crassa OR74A]|eukprot:XP_001728281.2 hypothetical protein NCU11290 [Neurospora crassa OR74A]